METIGIISGYFSFLHAGHIEYIQAAAKECDKLIVIVNNDIQTDKKGSKRLIDENHRCKILESIKGVYQVVLSIDTDRDVCNTIRSIVLTYPNRKYKFLNSGDRTDGNIDNKEAVLCKELNIEYVFINLPKIYASSDILKNV